MAVAINWGSALLIVFGFVLTVVYQTHHFDKRFDYLDKRIDDLRDLTRSEIRRVEERMGRIEDRLDRLERPIYRP
jgi:hypothetical protein